MKRFATRWVVGAAVLAGGLGAALPTWAQQQQDTPAAPATLGNNVSERNIQPAFTLPLKEYKISFPTMGVIKDVKVKEGDVVKVGDVLMKQDDSEDRAELRLLELDINNFPIDAAEAKLRVAESAYKAKKANHDKGAFNDLEVEQAQAERDVAKAQLDQSKQELEQKKAKRDKQKIHVENMTLKAEMNGVVRELINDRGSNVDPTKPVLTLVDNSTLLVQVQVPAIASLQLKKGEKLRVSYDKKNWREASVAFMDPQADAQSGMRMIRLEMPNPQGEPSGLQAFVELSEKLLASMDEAGK
jgi:RND family efflux transporter MFP subunit